MARHAVRRERSTHHDAARIVSGAQQPPRSGQHVPPARARARMVGWYDPQVLGRSAVLVAVANLFGRHSDSRLIEALSGQPQSVFDYSRGEGEFWLDYVADLGDGFNSTYAVARSIAQPTLEVHGRSGQTEQTRAGQVLVFGGDEVYPYPSREAYEVRTENVYRTALVKRGAPPDLFAIPGNHDWYDSLVAFSRAFCRPERGFAGMRTQQTRSYFALRLPGRWWLLGIDLQLGAELDEPQVQYFQKVASQMEPDAHVILCVPEPQWILEKSYPDYRSYDDHTLKFIEQQVLARRVQVFLSGDQHYYKRHENAEGVQKITAGGGGAFLHPTHAPDTRHLAGGFRERLAYPDPRTSSALTWRNLLFPYLNPGYLPLAGTLYMLCAWFASSGLGANDITDVRTALHAVMTAAIRNPLDGLWLMFLIVAFVFFTDTHVRWYRVIGGISHALAHLFSAFGVGWLALRLTVHVFGLDFGTIAQLLTAGLVTFLLGGIVSALILGLYLTVSLQVFGRHANEAFSALRIEDWKHWLRLRIRPSGELSVFVIGIDRVPRRWRRAPGDGEGTLEPNDRRAAMPKLIEAFSVAPRRDAG
jgi:hypothetical protein